MGTICILLGVITLICMSGMGFFITEGILSDKTYSSLMGLKNVSPTSVYLLIVGICFVIGLLICLNLVMHGMNYNKMIKLEAAVRQSRRDAREPHEAPHDAFRDELHQKKSLPRKKTHHRHR